MFENPRRSRQVRNFTTNVPKILALKSSSEEIFFRKLSLGAPDPFVCSTWPSDKALSRCVEGPEVESVQNLFLIASFLFFCFLLFFFFFSFSFHVCYISIYSLQFLDLQIFFSALLAVPQKSCARSCDLRISGTCIFSRKEVQILHSGFWNNF